MKQCLTMSSSSLHPTGKHYFYCAPSSLIGYCSHRCAPSASPVGTVSWTGIAHITAPELGLSVPVLFGVVGPVMWGYLLSRDRQQVDHFSLCCSTLCSKAQRVLDKIIPSIFIKALFSSSPYKHKLRNALK